MRRETTKRESDAPGVSPVAMAHLLRGELARSDTWRTRLDTTMNWALTTTGAVVSFSFSAPTTSHIVLLVGLWLVTMFLLLEARRYRYYDLWNRRVRLIEGGYWAPMLRREPVDPDAIRQLASDFDRPQLQLSLFSAIATRLTRAYGPLLAVLLASWFAKVYGHPRPVQNWDEFFTRAHTGPVPGVVVVGLLALFAIAFVFAWVTAMIIRPPMGELRPRSRPHRLPFWETMFRPYAAPPPARRHGPPRSQNAQPTPP